MEMPVENENMHTQESAYGKVWSLVRSALFSPQEINLHCGWWLNILMVTHKADKKRTKWTSGASIKHFVQSELKNIT